MPRQSKPKKDNAQAQWKEDAATLSYEESLQALDLLLSKLQDDSIPLSELQGGHQRAASARVARADTVLWRQ